MGPIVLFLFWFSFVEDFAINSLIIEYGLEGRSIHFNIIDTNQSVNVKWRRSDEISTRQFIADIHGVSPNYKEKVRINSDKSLTIINLQKNDSGTYNALTNWEDQILAEFKLTVENAVSKPKITSHDFNLTTGGCQTSVNCSADGSWATYNCAQNLCTQILSNSQVSPTSINISVTALGNRHVQCLAQNHVSSNKSTITIMCQEKQSELRPPSSFVFWIIILCVGVVLGLLLGLIVALFKRKKSPKVYPQPSSIVVDNTVNEQGPETIYSTVQEPKAFQAPSGNNTDSSIDTTIYDIPSKHPKVHQADSVEVNQEKQRPQEDRTVKVTATVHQAAELHSEQIDTVYCKLGEI